MTNYISQNDNRSILIDFFIVKKVLYTQNNALGNLKCISSLNKTITLKYIHIYIEIKNIKICIKYEYEFIFGVYIYVLKKRENPDSTLLSMKTLHNLYFSLLSYY